MTIQELIEELQEKHREFEKVFPHYAEALANFETLKDARDALLKTKSDILNKCLDLDDGAEWKANKKARDAQEYQDLIEDINNLDAALGDARKRWRKGWGVVEPIKMRIESLRTEISASKVEARAFGG